MSLRISAIIVILFLGGILPACSRQETAPSGSDERSSINTAHEFVQALASRDYARAYTLTTRTFRKGMSQDDLQRNFEQIVPRDWKMAGPVTVANTMKKWPHKLPSDMAWISVSIGGDIYSEAVSVIVAREDQGFRIRHVEFGRP